MKKNADTSEKKSRGFTQGFTLIELLVVIAIIGVLSSVVLASLNTARARARNAQRLADLSEVRKALEMYASDNGGTYPSTGGMSSVYMDPGCAQTNPGSGDWVPNLVPAYMPALPRDPRPISQISPSLASCYMYSSNGQHYLLTAYGTVEAGSNGGRMDSDFGYREPSNMLPRTIAYCRYSTSYPSIDVVHRRSFTLTTLTTSNFSICAKIGP
jgi:type II secretion system protein G